MMNRGKDNKRDYSRAPHHQISHHHIASPQQYQPVAPPLPGQKTERENHGPPIMAVGIIGKTPSGKAKVANILLDKNTFRVYSPSPICSNYSTKEIKGINITKIFEDGDTKRNSLAKLEIYRDPQHNLLILNMISLYDTAAFQAIHSFIDKNPNVSVTS
jgi:hypothetical protein